MNRPQALEPQAELVYHSPSLLEEFGAAGITLLVFFLLVVLILGGLTAFVTGSSWAIFAFVVIILIGAASLAAVLALWRGKVVLAEDGLVEYNGLNAARRFGYDQIYDFKNGAHANSLVIYYYPRLENGTIDTFHPQRTRLISVKNDTGLKIALARRLTASQTDLPAGKDRLPVFVLLLFLLVAFPILLFLGLNWR